MDKTPTRKSNKKKVMLSNKEDKAVAVD